MGHSSEITVKRNKKRKKGRNVLSCVRLNRSYSSPNAKTNFPYRMIKERKVSNFR